MKTKKELKSLLYIWSDSDLTIETPKKEPTTQKSLKEFLNEGDS